MTPQGGPKPEVSLDTTLRQLHMSMHRKGVLPFLQSSFLPGQRCIPELSEAKLEAAAAAGGLGTSAGGIAAKSVSDLSSVFVNELPRAAKVMLVAGGVWCFCEQPTSGPVHVQVHYWYTSLSQWAETYLLV